MDMAPDGTVYGIELLNANEQLRREEMGALVVVNEATGERAELPLAVRGTPCGRGATLLAHGDGVGRCSIACALGKDVRERLAEAVVRGSFGLLELRPAGMSLEEIFLKLTTKEEELEGQ